MIIDKQNFIKLYSEDDIKYKIKQIGKQISKDYENKELVIIGVLNGSFLFLSDLIKEITISDFEIDFIKLSSYKNSTDSYETVDELIGLNSEIEGKHILIVEDIIDTGLTIEKIIDILNYLNPLSINICVLIDKKERRIKNRIKPKYIGFNLNKGFIVGYGLDYKKKYRNLKDIYVMK